MGAFGAYMGLLVLYLVMKGVFRIRLIILFLGLADCFTLFVFDAMRRTFHDRTPIKSTVAGDPMQRKRSKSMQRYVGTFVGIEA